MRVMNTKIIMTVFVTVFLAELGDKTQLATMLFSADREISKFTVFCAAAFALLLSTAIAVTFGGIISNFVNRRILTMVAGAGFIAVGIWTFMQGIRTTV
jgi:putative Ca2+/H+ antiporter (TMEM165/GDT1 family)